MAKKCLKVKARRRKESYVKALRMGRKPKFMTRVYNRCHLCGRSRGYLRKFDLCRICVRQLASQDMITGLQKASW